MAEHEIWKACVGFKGKYEVSDQGRVRSLPRIICYGRVRRRIPLRILALLNGPGGYVTVHLGQKTTKSMNKYVHHLVMKSFVGKVPKGKEILHNNGNKKDNRLVNLRFGTRSENMQDALRHRYERAWLEYAQNTEQRYGVGNRDCG